MSPSPPAATAEVEVDDGNRSEALPGDDRQPADRKVSLNDRLRRWDEVERRLDASEPDSVAWNRAVDDLATLEDV